MMTIFILYLTLLGLVSSTCPWDFDADPNPNGPKFVKNDLHFQLPVETPVGTVITQMNATDLDKNDTLFYSFGWCPPIEYIHINETSGILSTKQSLQVMPFITLVCKIKVRDRAVYDHVYKIDTAMVEIEVYSLLTEEPSHGFENP